MRTFRFAAMLLVGLLCGCSSLPVETSPDQSDRSRNSFAVVERRTITDAIALGGIVRSQVTYLITAPAEGAVRQRGAGFRFSTAGGNAHSTALTLPPTATAVEVLVPEGVVVAANTPILSVTDAALLMVAEVPPADVLRIGVRDAVSVRSRIDGSSAPFDCPLTDPRVGESDGTYTVACRIPSFVPAVVGAVGQVVLVLERREATLALPIEAVTGTLSNGSVVLRGAASPVEVDLGITDGVYVEILKGLREGQQVRIPSPGLLEG